MHDFSVPTSKKVNFVRLYVATSRSTQRGVSNFSCRVDMLGRRLPYRLM